MKGFIQRMLRTGKKNSGGNELCNRCGARCCTHIALEIDRPTTKAERDYIRWYLLHGGVEVFIDHHKHWFIKVPTPCDMLKEGLCTIYETRPDICREYPEPGTVCEFDGDGAYYLERFTTPAEFERYLRKKPASRSRKQSS